MVKVSLIFASFSLTNDTRFYSWTVNWTRFLVSICPAGPVGADRDGDGAEGGVPLQHRLREHPLQSVRVPRPAADPRLAQRVPRRRAGQGAATTARSPAAGRHVWRLVGRGQRAQPHPRDDHNLTLVMVTTSPSS